MPFPTTLLSAEVRALTDCLMAAPVGSTVTYADMSAAIGADIKARRYLILRAIRVSLRESGAIFGCITRVGYQRLSAEDAHTLGSHARGRIRRASSRAANAISRSIAVANDVSDKAKASAFAEISALQLIRHISSDKSRATIKDVTQPQPVAVTMLDMMRKIGVTQNTDEAA